MLESRLLGRIKINVAVATFSAFLAFFNAPPGATQEATHCPNPIYEAQKFVQTLYPETNGKGYGVLFGVGGGYDAKWISLPRLEIIVVHTNFVPSIDLVLVDKAQYTPLDPKLMVSFDFDKESRIERANFAGPLVEDNKNEHFSLACQCS
jgi:hypothetical protein